MLPKCPPTPHTYTSTNYSATTNIHLSFIQKNRRTFQYDIKKTLCQDYE